MNQDPTLTDVGRPVRTVRLLTTGGTIATRLDPDTGKSAPALSAADVARLAPGFETAEIVELARTPSWAMSLADMAGVARAARSATEGQDVAGVVVTVGTSTLEYVAFLTDLFVDSPVPVVFTGAMRRADEPSPDGPRNLADAFRVACSPQARDRGVLVVFAGKVLSARGCWKLTRSANDAFIDVEGPIGTVDELGARFVRMPARVATLAAQPDESVEVLKVYPGAGGELLDAVAGRAPRGLVIEGLPGAGGIPPAMQPGLERLSATDTVVVISSRAPSGAVPDPATGGTGSPLRELPILSAGLLTTEKAWVLLSVVLGECDTAAEARARFTELTRGHHE